ncbi:hypothetical protein ACFY2Y_09405 [Janibacter hoylei]|uniref:hypothetical protein n=1 Tax=Janibacter hoylei TaxID=364298 RepID=UPI0036779783
MTDDRGRYVSASGAKPAESAALRRAAYQLEREGLIQLRLHRGRLAMFRPDVEPRVRGGFLEGADGRIYRTPHEPMTREAVEDAIEERRQHQEFLARYDPIAEKHGHPHGPGIFMCYECAESAGADADLLARLR